MRNRISLNGAWDLKPVFARPAPRISERLRALVDAQKDLGPQDRSEWPLVAQVPAAWELALEPTYDGACLYRTTFQGVPVPKGHRLWLVFQGVATHADIWLNGRKLGAHSGNWTPFEFDITEDCLPGENLLIVRAEEDRDHVTRSFTCIAMPHHGGIWQEVFLEIRPKGYILTPIQIESRVNEGKVLLEIAAVDAEDATVVATLVTDDGREALEEAQGKVEGGLCRLELPAGKLQLWDIDEPNLYVLWVQLLDGEKLLDEVTERFGYREIRADGTRFLLNGRPIYPRGCLTWGVYPEHIAPSPTLKQVRDELRKLQSLGFNLVKLCLLLPPPSFFDVADELGMLVWLEYPTWQTGSMFGLPYYAEFEDMFLRDRNHPSIVIRSITCESHGADPEALKHLYQRAKEIVPGSLVMDNSGFFLAWSEKNPEMFTDLYSDHPYWDCHHLDYFLQEVEDRMSGLPLRPFITGESMDCDTYRNSADYLRAFPNGLPWWAAWGDNPPAPLCGTDIPTQIMRENQFAAETGRPFPANLGQLSFNHAQSHHKYQVEQFRKRARFGGYTLLMNRDSVGNPAGFFDDFGQLKWTPGQTLPWNSDTVLLLDTPDGSFNLKAGQKATFKLSASVFHKELPAEGFILWKLKSHQGALADDSSEVSIPEAGIHPLAEVQLQTPATGSPQVLQLDAELILGRQRFSNSWKLWVFPEASFPEGAFLASGAEELSGQLSLPHQTSLSASSGGPAIAVRMDEKLLRWVECGGRAVVVLPADTPFPVETAGFWRESVMAFVDTQALGDFPHESFIDLQFLPLSSNHRMTTSALAGGADILLRRVNPRSCTYGEDMVQMRVGRGVALITTLNLLGENNFTGHYLLGQMAGYIWSEACQPARELTVEHLLALQSEK